MYVGSIHFMEESLLSPYKDTFDLCSTAVFDVEEAAGQLRKAHPSFFAVWWHDLDHAYPQFFLRVVGLNGAHSKSFPAMVHFMRKLLRLFIAYDDKGRAFSFLRCVVCA